MKLNSTREHKIINALGTTLSYKGSKHINGNRSNEIFSVIPTQFPTHWTLTLTGSHLQPLKKAFWVSLLEKKNIIRTFRWVLKDSTVGKIPSKSSKTYRIERCRPKVKYFPISPPPPYTRSVISEKTESLYCSPGWAGTLNTPASISAMLGLDMCHHNQPHKILTLNGADIFTL